MAVTAAPPGEEQRKVIASLEKEEESIHVYLVAKDWYEQWQQFVGTTEAKPSKSSKPPAPGPVTMDKEIEDNNMYVDEKIWTRWISWHGVADAHELDRRNWTSDDKTFEICVLSPYSGILENTVKTFDVSEVTGYIELQLRKIFQVPDHRQTRLWACERTRSARFSLLLNRSLPICYQETLDSRKEYILALEVSNPNASWPTLVPGKPKGGFEKYTKVTQGLKTVEFWEGELTSAVETVFQGISGELKETVLGVVETSKIITKEKEETLSTMKDKLTEDKSLAANVMKELTNREKQLKTQEDALGSDQSKLRRKKEKLEQEQAAFEQELKSMQELNKIRESKVKLDIGGCVYTTSILTLTKDSNSMLAAMFSGRHSLKQETDGSYFIDRDGTHFRFILNYLRDGGFREGMLPNDVTFLNELLTEAEYYQIDGLVQLLTDRTKTDPEEGVQERRPNQRKAYRKIAHRPEDAHSVGAGAHSVDENRRQSRHQ